MTNFLAIDRKYFFPDPLTDMGVAVAVLRFICDECEATPFLSSDGVFGVKTKEGQSIRFTDADLIYSIYERLTQLRLTLDREACDRSKKRERSIEEGYTLDEFDEQLYRDGLKDLDAYNDRLMTIDAIERIVRMIKTIVPVFSDEEAGTWPVKQELKEDS